MASIDRNRTSPFLVRAFIKTNGQHGEAASYAHLNAPHLTKSEHCVYAWKDSTLRELVLLLRSVNPSIRAPGNAKFSIRHVYQSSASSSSSIDAEGSWRHKDLGFVFARDLAGKFALFDSQNGGRGNPRNDPSLKTLEHHRFLPGDYFDIAYITSSGPNAGGPGGPPITSIRGAASTSALPGSRLNGAPGGLSEADQAWGIAGDRAPRGASIRGRAGPSGGNRFNPLLAGRGGMSIMGMGRRSERGIHRDNDRPRKEEETERVNGATRESDSARVRDGQEEDEDKEMRY